MFTEAEKRVFEFFDGKQKAFADPLAVHRRFMEALDGDPNPVLKAAHPAQAGTEDEPAIVLARLDAQRRLADAGRAAFEMPAYDRATGEGATEDDCLQALYAWLDWMDAKKKSAENSPTFSPPSESAPAPSTTQPSSDSGET